MLDQKSPKFVGNTTNPSKPVWNEYVDEEGHSTLEEIHPKEIWRACKKHFFVMADNMGNLTCRNCGFGQKISWGIHILKKGKIVKLKRP